MNPELFDWYHLGISGGKDSTATLLWLIYLSGWDLSKVKVSFCDTQNEDPLTYAYINMLSENVFPIEYLLPKRIGNKEYPEGISFFELAKIKGRFPASKARFCTQVLKIFATRDLILRLLKDYDNPLLLSGVRKSEGSSINDRETVGQFNWDEGFGLYQYRPLYEMSIRDVWQLHKDYLNLDMVLDLINNDPTLKQNKKDKLINRMKAHGIPRNPLYDMGATRVGCFPCIMSKKEEIRAIDEYRPERIEEISLQEIEVGKTGGRKRKIDLEISSFFALGKIPEKMGSVKFEKETGEIVKIPTIHDVVRWSKTSRGGKNYDIISLYAYEDEEYDQNYDDIPACDLTGFCE